MSTGSPPSRARSTRSQRAYIGLAILLFAGMSAYLALVIITRVDSLFGPTVQVTLPGGETVGNFLPGVDATGDSGDQSRVNILVMGLDRRDHEGDAPSRTDTIFVVSVDPKTKTSKILGIPRDLVVDIPAQSGGTYEDRINTVYVAGELTEYPGGGVGMMKDVLEAEPFNIEIDKYVLVDFEGFEEIIDALGGIDVDVPDEVYDPYYSETEILGDYDPQHFEAGRQHMDGATALAYSRIRFSSDDFDRIQRQQRVIFAVVEKAKSVDVLSKAPELWGKYKDTIDTDISDLQIPGYALLASSVQDNLTAVSLGPATAPYTTTGGAAVLGGDEELIGQIVDSVFRDAEPGDAPLPEVTPEPVLVEVQNGTGTDQFASRVVSFIASKGYPVDDLNAANVYDGELHSTSEIIDVSGANRGNAYLLAKWLGLEPATVRDATADEKVSLGGGSASIVIIVGSDVDIDDLNQAPAGEVSGG